MELIFSEINLVFSIICSISVEDKNNWTMINFSKFNSLGVVDYEMVKRVA